MQLRRPASGGATLRDKCRVVNQFLITAGAAGIQNPAMRQRVISKIGHRTAVEPLETHRVSPQGGYITLGETQTQYAILHNPRTGTQRAQRLRTSVLLPRAVIDDVYNVARAQANGRKVKLQPKSAELLRHEGMHARRATAGVAGMEKARLFKAWERRPRQLKRDLGIVVGSKQAEAMIKSHPTWQVMEFLDTVQEERMADEAAIAGKAREMVWEMGARAIRSPQEYLKIIEASERAIMKGRPPAYQRAVEADIAVMRQRLAGVKFEKPKGLGALEGWADTLNRFATEIGEGTIGRMGSYSIGEMVRAGGPGKMRRV